MRAASHMTFLLRPAAKVVASLWLALYVSAFACAADGSKLVYFDQPESTQIFAAADAKGQFWTLIRYFETQRMDTFCSVASSTMVLNSLQVRAAIQQPLIYPYNAFNHETFFTPAVLKLQRVRHFTDDGLTLAELADVLKTFNVSVDKYHADTLPY